MQTSAYQILCISHFSNDIANPIYGGTSPSFDPSPGPNPTYDDITQSVTQPVDTTKQPLIDPAPGDTLTYDSITQSNAQPPKLPLFDAAPGDNPTYDSVILSAAQPVDTTEPPLFDPVPGDNPTYDSVILSAAQPVDTTEPPLFDPAPGDNPTYDSVTLLDPPKQLFDNMPPETNPGSIPSPPVADQSDSTLPPPAEYDPETDDISPGISEQEYDRGSVELAESSVPSYVEENGSEKQRSINIYGDEF